MTKGTAATWSQAYYTRINNKIIEKARLTNANKPAEAALIQPWGTYDDFQQEFWQAFTAHDTQNAARLKLQTLKQANIPNKNIDTFISEFQMASTESGITDENALIDWFAMGLLAPISKAILNRESPPATLAGWIQAAAKTSTNQRRLISLISGSTPVYARNNGFTSQSNNNNRNNSHTNYKPARDPMAMDIDAVRLTKEQEQEHRQKGLCFKCHKQGHMQNDREFHPRNNNQNGQGNRNNGNNNWRNRQLGNHTPERTHPPK
ncbi:hypothetical protein CONPUDRAFT_78480 [Coniophora puteana RWD-64-598 SS2]|uniref:Retrotransposon gag domain-containing protein n=1 Tax=Coniophora puteana (strain RWD-64-598) TaxID=741705 RepID=R7SCE1_CONPW|nr:uncharacterized protein CONPUDRAFT_78480 [Coniophora puteana RWD-64-598 SS2]EIW73823.1 hypothetical protein CONPUDRAFT_78480 [Coniophora puteana RWD-64-598 SS2]